MPENDGGPAFACGVSVDGKTEGLSILDWFAGMALQGMYASDTKDWNSDNDINYALRVEIAYKVANAMLRERAKL